MSSKLHPDSSYLLDHFIKPAFEISLKKTRLRVSPRVSRNNQNDIDINLVKRI